MCDHDRRVLLATKITRSKWRLANNVLLCLLIACHVGLLLFSAIIHSPVIDELGHLPSGYVNHFGHFDAYRVNPPLVRMIAAQPLVWMEPNLKFYTPPARGEIRSEVGLAVEYLRQTGRAGLGYFIWGRVMLVPFSILGLIVTWQWARELYGSGAGLVAAAFWCFCPNILAHGSLLTPDLAVTALWVLTGYLLWKGLRQGLRLRDVLMLSITITLATLCKFTALILVGYVLVAIGAHFMIRGQIRQGFVSMVVIPAVLCLGVALCYQGQGLFQQLHDLPIISHAFSEMARNVFFGRIPLPLPEDFVLGLDRQRFDLESKLWSYFCGEWRQHGWWHYYAVGILIKTPLATLAAATVGVAVAVKATIAASGTDRHHNGPWWLTVFGIPAALFLVVSSQTGFNHHLRYTLPVYPFLFIMGAGALHAIQPALPLIRRVRASLLASLVFLAAVASISNYPHSLSFFNYLVGGSANGHWYLINSNADWGQDTYLLMNRLDQRQGVSITGADLVYPNEIVLPGVPAIPMNPGPGWYVISVDRLHDRRGKYASFLATRPCDRVGFSLFIYYIPGKVREPSLDKSTAAHGDPTRP